MSVEFIGMIGTQSYSEIHPPRGPAIDIDYVRRFTQAHEQADFDRILIGYFSNAADGFIVASYAAFVTHKLGLMLAHRPGFVAPTLAARKLATLDQFSGGRLGRAHHISGGDDTDQRRDGDLVRMMNAMRVPMSSRNPAPHVDRRQADRAMRGKYYRFEGPRQRCETAAEAHIANLFGGSSEAAIAVAGRHADVYALWGEPLAEAAKTIAASRADGGAP